MRMRIIFPQFALFAGLLVLIHCNSYGLQDRLESPGSDSTQKSGSGTTGATAIYMFKTASTYNGNLATAGGAAGNGRQGADNLCTSVRPGFVFPDNSCASIRAFISISSADSIANMPANYGISSAKPIKGPTDIMIDNDWPSLMSQPIVAASLFAGGVLPASVNWWSFSANTANGLFDGTANCAGGTDGVTVTPGGAQGNSGVANTAWLNNGNASCATALHVLCLCY